MKSTLGGLEADMGVGAAILGASAIAGVGSIASGIMGSNAASDAASTQAAAADRASQAALQQYYQTREDFTPYRDAGQQGLRLFQNALYGGGGEGTPNLLTLQGFAPNPVGVGARMTFQPTIAELEATPGYQFIRDQGLKSVQSSAAARGLGVSGAAMKGAANFAEGLAGTTLGQQQQIFQQNLANVLNPLQSLAQMGQSAAGQTGTFGASAINSASQAAMSGAASQAAGIVGSSNALSGALGTAANLPMNYMLYNQLLGGGGGGGFWSSGGSNTSSYAPLGAGNY
jgi:hypothetical protein